MDENIDESPQYRPEQVLCKSTAVDYTSVPPTDDTFSNFVAETISPSSAFPLELNDNLTLKYPISDSSQLLLDPLSIAMHLQLNILKKDGTKLKETEFAAFIAGILYTMFSKVEIWANGRIFKVSAFF